MAQLAPAEAVGRLALTHAHPRWIAQAFADALGADAGELGDALAADDTRPLVHLAARPGLIAAAELAAATGGQPGALLALRGVPGLRWRPGARWARCVRVWPGCRTRAANSSPRRWRWRRWRVPTGCAGWIWRPVRGARRPCSVPSSGWPAAAWTRWSPARTGPGWCGRTTRGLDVAVHEVDGRNPGLEPGYDRVLLDAPCTGLGALRRRPEARWRRQPAAVGELVALQRELLASALALVRPGGVVVYSTCSPHLAETTGVVGDAVRRGAQVLDARELMPRRAPPRPRAVRPAVAAPPRHRRHVRRRPARLSCRARRRFRKLPTHGPPHDRPVAA